MTRIMMMIMMMMVQIATALTDDYYKLVSSWKDQGILYHNTNMQGCPTRTPLTIRETDDAAVKIVRFCEACTGKEIALPHVNTCVRQVEELITMRGNVRLCGNVMRYDCYSGSSRRFLGNENGNASSSLVSEAQNACAGSYSCTFDAIRRIWMFVLLFEESHGPESNMKSFLSQLETDKSLLSADNGDIDDFETFLFASQLPLHRKKRITVTFSKDKSQADLTFGRTTWRPLTSIRSICNERDALCVRHFVKMIFPRLFEIVNTEALADSDESTDKDNINNDDESAESCNVHDGVSTEPPNVFARARDAEKFQQYLEKIQHASKCDRLYVWSGWNPAGLGSQVNVLVNSFLVSIFHERTFVSAAARTQYVDPTRCRTMSFDACLLEPLSNCKISDVLASRHVSLANEWSEDRHTADLQNKVFTELRAMFPTVIVDTHDCHHITFFERIAKRAGLSQEYGPHWFFMEAFRFIYKPSSVVLRAANDLGKYLDIHRTKEDLRRRIVGVHWRQGDKQSAWISSNWTVEEYALVVRERAHALSAKTVFMSSNAKPEIQSKFVDLIEGHDTGIRVVYVPLHLYRTLDKAGETATHQDVHLYEHAVDKEAATEQIKTLDFPVDEGILLMATLELFARCDDFVGSFGSNFGRIVYQIKEMQRTGALLGLAKAWERDPSVAVEHAGAELIRSEPRVFDMDGNSFYTCGRDEDRHSIAWERSEIRRRKNMDK
eukprot:g691.t1